MEKYGPNYLHEKLKQLDPVDAQKIHPNNTKRLIRALEIYEITGNSKTESAKSDKILQYDIDFYVLDNDRQVLYENIAKRVNIMIDFGLEKEVKFLLDSGCDFNMQSMQGIGYKEFKGYFDGKITLEQVKNEIILNSRHYAKRQITWFKRYEFAKNLTKDQLIEKFNL